MVKAPANSLSPDNSKNYQYKATTENKTLRGHNSSSSSTSGGGGGGVVHHYTQFHFKNNNNNNNNNSKKSNRRLQMAEPPGAVSGSGPTLLVTTVTPISVTPSPQSGTPMIAVVAPTARTTTNTNNNSHINGNHSPIKATSSANLVQQQSQQQQQQQQQQRLHPIPHIYHLPVQIPANLLTGPTQATNVWSTALVEPAFHFGPGFERAPNTSIMEIQNQRQIACPTHGTQNNQNPSTSGTNCSQEHVVLFHVSPGVSVTFQIGGNREVVRVFQTKGPSNRKVPFISQHLIRVP
uniref:CSON007933 protein n=1 Tax=Culicoides sonorensis TaxID=179676 RepID=A0A336LGL7_CULSO